MENRGKLWEQGETGGYRGIQEETGRNREKQRKTRIGKQGEIVGNRGEK